MNTKPPRYPRCNQSNHHRKHPQNKWRQASLRRLVEGVCEKYRKQFGDQLRQHSTDFITLNFINYIPKLTQKEIQQFQVGYQCEEIPLQNISQELPTNLGVARRPRLP